MRLIQIVLALAFLMGLPQTVTANEQAKVDNVDAKKKASAFKLPERKSESIQPAKEFSLKSAIGDTGIKVGICVGVFLIAVLLLSRQKGARPIPREAVEILGTVPLASRQQVQLIRFGQKLVLVESSSNGLKPISEITDQGEVNRLMDMIRPRTQ